MKCLGALDRFILRLFLLEAGIQGLVGAFFGAVAGLAIGLATGLVRFGWVAVAGFPAAGLWRVLSVSIAVGVGLSLLGVVYPAVVAARMRPVEAMRYGGVVLFKRVRLLFVGLILGDFLMGGVFALIGLWTGQSYLVLPN